MYDVAIIGGGIIGAMTARKLSKYHLKICILEKENDVAMGTTKANSAIVHAGFDAEPGTLKAILNVKGSQMMPSICQELGVSYKNNGSLVIGYNSADRGMIEDLLERGILNGVQGLRILNREALKALEPNISDHAICALYAPTGAIVCPYGLAIAAIGNAMDNGAELRCNFEVSKILKAEDSYEIFSDTDSVVARYIVNCAGLYSDQIAKMVGDASFEVHPRRGEYVLLDKECGTLISHTIFRTPSKAGKGILVTPTIDGNLLFGPTSVDMEDKTGFETTASGLALVMEKAREYLSAVPAGKNITSFCGLRAVGNTGDFIITSPQNGFINLAGIESPGLSAAPAIAEHVAEMLKEQGLELIPNPDFNPFRASAHAFRDASIEEKNAMIKSNPAYGKIVCRCESISEGEILDAIHRNPPARDLDGVKRRTRAQMGRCQGGFCGPYIADILAKEHNMPLESVTKFGGASTILVSKTKGGLDA